MEKFLDNLYSYENFGIYLIIAIVVLIILFFVVLFFGKKDKKIRELEETKRLEKLNPDLFKLDEPKKEDELEIKERLFRVILVVGTIAVGVAILQGLTLVNAENLMGIYIIMFIAFVMALVLTFKYHNIELSSTLLGIAIIVVALPFIFLKGGGVYSGAGTWMCLGIFYVFIMFSGKKLTAFLILTLGVDIICYAIAYFYPEYVIELATPFEKNFDSLFAVIVVGITVGTVLKFQLKVFERERRINEEQKEQLRTLSVSKDNFFASMSHEIRTPIHSILGLNELILREEPSNTIKEYVSNIQVSSQLLLGLVNDILDLSQLQNEQMALTEAEYDSKELFRSVVDVMLVQTCEKDLEFHVEIDKTLPKILYGDVQRIRQILMNLLSNAIKYTEKGSISLSCSYEMQEKDRAVLKISVADTGIGIRKEELDYLFDAFCRVDAEKNHKIEGTGLGLSIVRYLLTLMGGDISVDSIYTQGSLFTVTLPQKVINKAPMGEFVSAWKENKVGIHYDKAFEAPDARILIVDDDDLSLIITAKLLQETRMTIDMAQTREEFLRKTGSRYYNLILMDYMMPEKNGEELLREIRYQENGFCKETPVVLLTANTFQEKYLQMGFDGFLEKPVNTQKLEEEILRHLPNELIEYRRDARKEHGDINFVSTLQSKKRKKVTIISDNVCDIPIDLLEKYDIRIINLYIQTEFGRFCDSKEIDVNNISRYMSEKESKVQSLSATVEEYEHFFAETLMESEDLIYISLAKGTGRCFENAVSAAKGFDHVHVINSGYISGAQGLIVLHAGKMAKRGASVELICEEINRIKKNINMTILLPSVTIFRQKGYTDIITARICEIFNLRPVLGISNSKIHVYGVRFGRLENVWRKCIRYHLRNIKHIDDNIIFVTHAGLSVRQQELILDEIHRCVKFKHIIFTQASVANVCNAGLNSIGFAVYRK